MITATDSAAQKYATVFPEYFVKAMKEASTRSRQERPHIDLRGVPAASAAVKQHYEQRGQLSTERALIDDNGDGKGREAPPTVPTAASRGSRILIRRVVAESANPELATLINRRRALEQQAEEHKELKGVMPDAEWQARLRKTDAGAGAGLGGNQEEVLTEESVRVDRG